MTPIGIPCPYPLLSSSIFSRSIFSQSWFFSIFRSLLGRAFRRSNGLLTSAATFMAFRYASESFPAPPDSAFVTASGNFAGEAVATNTRGEGEGGLGEGEVKKIFINAVCTAIYYSVRVTINSSVLNHKKAVKLINRFNRGYLKLAMV